MQQNGGEIAGQPDTDLKLEEDSVLSEGARLTYAGVRLVETKDVGERQRRAVLSVEPLETWKPDGFEVKVGGASGSRKIWIHTAVESPMQNGRRAVPYAATTVAHARDF